MKDKTCTSDIFCCIVSEKRQKSIAQAHTKLCAEYENEGLKERKGRNWFTRFYFNFSLKTAQ